MNKKKRKNARRQARRETAEGRAAYLREQRLLKAERKAQQRAKVAQVLSTHQSKEAAFRRSGVHYALERVILQRARKLMDPRVRGPLGMLGGLGWVRPIDEWKPKGKSPTSLLRSLFKHLLVKYTMPDFMFGVFFEEDADLRKHGINVFLHIAHGGSLYKACKNRLFPVPLTKRMCHEFMQSTNKLSFIEAVRHAQVRVYGGDRRLAEAVCGTLIGRRFQHNEAAWDKVIQWVCNQGMLAPGQVGPIFDWVGARMADTEGFVMQGRTGVSVLRSVDEWHGELTKDRKINGHRYNPSGFEEWAHERKVKMQPGVEVTEQHTITEIRTSKLLAAEGRNLHHCVYSYSRYIVEGRTSIWSYKIDETRQLTVEVDNANRRVVQVRGKWNRAANPSQMAMVERWMKKNQMIWASWLR